MTEVVEDRISSIVDIKQRLYHLNSIILIIFTASVPPLVHLRKVCTP
jgi:hypothetical protein